MKRKGTEGFGLIILVMLIALSGILISSTALMTVNSGREMQLRIDRTKAYFLAQTGVMQALQDWRASNSSETARRYAELNTTVTGNQIFKTGSQANFAYFNFTSGPANWFTSGSNRRLRRWAVTNIHTSSPTLSLVLTGIKVTWSPVGTERLQRVFLNNTNVIQSGGPFNSGFAQTSLGGSASARTLAPGASWSGLNTYLQWSNNNTTMTTVTAQFTFSDNSATKDSTTHEVVFWGPGVAQTGSPPSAHTFSITSTGQVNQSGGWLFKVLETVKATVSGAPSSGSDMEIVDWNNLDKNIP